MNHQLNIQNIKDYYQISISIPQEAVSAAIQKAIKNISPHAQIPGFRKGKVPAKLILTHYPNTITSMASEELSSLISNILSEELEKRDIKGYLIQTSRPEISITNPSSITFEYLLFPSPKITKYPEYKNQTISYTKVSPTQDDTNLYIKYIISIAHPKLLTKLPSNTIPTPKAVFKVSVSKENLEPAEINVIPILYFQYLLDGLEYHARAAGIINMNFTEALPGKTLTYPEDENSIKVNIIELYDLSTTPPTNTLATLLNIKEDENPYETISTYLNKIAEDINKETKINAILKHLIQNTEIDIPTSTIDYLIATKHNIPLDQLSKLSEDTLKELREKTKESITTQLIIDYIANEEKELVEKVKPDEIILEYLRRQGYNRGKGLAHAINTLRKNSALYADIVDNLIYKKTISFLLENNTFTPSKERPLYQTQEENS